MQLPDAIVSKGSSTFFMVRKMAGSQTDPFQMFLS